MRSLLRLLPLWLFFCSSLAAIPLPEIQTEDVITILHEIQESHATHKELSAPLVQRSLETFFDLLDPTKTYLLAHEVSPYLSLSEQNLNAIIAEIEAANFATYKKISAIMVKAIARRAKLDHQLRKTPRPTDVSAKEFAALPWARNLEDLKTRILRIEGLQRAALALLTQETTEKAQARILKRRTLFEQGLTSKEKEISERFFLTLVLRALTSSFDTHTSYFTPAEAAQFMVQVQQRLFGIGVQLRDDLNGFTILKVLEGGPASISDLKENDRIIAIQGEPVVGLDIVDAVELIRGEAGSEVILTVVRESDQKERCVDVPIIRGEVVLKEARLATELIPYADGVIAHLKLASFYQDATFSSAKDLRDKILEIKSQENLKGIILDLRHNSGGLLPQAVAVTGLFITKGIVVSIKDHREKVEHLREVDGKTAYDGPLLVLTSKASASAAEIVAQTLQDYGRAIVVGDEHTYGKGTFQTFTLDQRALAKINPKGEYKVTRGRYYTVSGKSPQLVGVTPDIIVSSPISTFEIGERYAKNPLENDSIPPNFDDDLSDIPPFQREQITWFYRFNLQKKISTFTTHLPKLQKNAKLRLEKHALHHRLLEELTSENSNHETVELLTLRDFQLEEAINILKDLIALLN